MAKKHIIGAEGSEKNVTEACKKKKERSNTQRGVPFAGPRGEKEGIKRGFLEIVSQRFRKIGKKKKKKKRKKKSKRHKQKKKKKKKQKKPKHKNRKKKTHRITFFGS